MKKVSIVIPVYNVEKYLTECLDSIVNQTYKNLQIIIVDDGSTDSSGEICDEYAVKDNRITVIHQENAGAANAKNTGIDNVKGDYLTFADSDDWVELNWIETMVNALEKYDVDVVECGFDKVFVNAVKEGKVYKDGEVLTAEEYFIQYVDNWVSVLFCNKMFKVALTENIRFRNERRCIDDEFYTYKVISNGKKVARVSDVLYHYRQRQSSAAHSKENLLKITDDNLEVLIERYKWITGKYKKLRSIYLNSDIDFLMYSANNFLFSDKLIKKHRRVSRFYLWQCLLHFPNIITVYNAIRNSFCNKRKYCILKKEESDEKNIFYD